MTATVHLDSNTVAIYCNNCGREAPPQIEIMKAGGLIAMGWYCAGGVHLCPAEEHPENQRRVNPPLHSTRTAR